MSDKRILKIYDPLFKTVKTYTVDSSVIKIGVEENCDLQINLPIIEDLCLVLNMDENTLAILKTGDMKEDFVCHLMADEVFRIHTVYFYYTSVDEERYSNIENDKKLGEKDEYISRLVSNQGKLIKKQIQYVDKNGKSTTIDLKNYVYKNKDISESVKESEDGKDSTGRESLDHHSKRSNDEKSGSTGQEATDGKELSTNNDKIEEECNNVETHESNVSGESIKKMKKTKNSKDVVKEGSKISKNKIKSSDGKKSESAPKACIEELHEDETSLDGKKECSSQHTTAKKKINKKLN